MVTEGGMAVGFVCPVCSCHEAEVAGYERNEDGCHVGVRLECRRCGHRWREGT